MNFLGKSNTMRITQITTQYDQQEDRMSLVVSSDEATTRRLWLTRRLIERLVPVLLDGLEIHLTPATSNAPEALPTQKQAAQVYAQLEARISRKPAVAVQVQPDTVAALVREISIDPHKNGGRTIQFICINAEPATLVLTETELRQWLQGVERACHKAQWRADIWPAWIAGSRGRTSSQKRRAD